MNPAVVPTPLARRIDAWAASEDPELRRRARDIAAAYGDLPRARAIEAGITAPDPSAPIEAAPPKTPPAASRRGGPAPAVETAAWDVVLASEEAAPAARRAQLRRRLTRFLNDFEVEPFEGGLRVRAALPEALRRRLAENDGVASVRLTLRLAATAGDDNNDAG